MQFDSTINPLQFNIAVSEEDGHLEFVIVTGTLLPVGPGQMIPLPIGVYRIPLPSKESAQEFYDQLAKAIEAMPDDKPKSDLIVANNVQQANQMAEQINKFSK